MFLKWIRKNKLKIITTGICTIAMALFTIVSFSCKTYAFTIDSNGNLVGENLFDYTNINKYELIGTNASSYYTYNNGVLETTHNSWFRNIGIRINLQANTTYTISAYSYSNNGNSFIRMSSNNPDGTDLGYMNFTNNNEYTYNYLTFTTTQDSNVLSIGVAYNGNTTGYFKNIMLNEGSTPKEYEPYGVWYSSANYNNLQEQYNGLYEAQQNNNLYYAFNNAEAKLYNALLNTPYENQTPIVSGTITLNQDDYYINAYSSQEISNYLNTYDSETWTIFYYTIMYIPNINFNNTFIVNVGDLTNDYNLTCYYTDGTSEKYNPRDLEDYVMIANKDRKNIKYITIDIYMPDYVSFELQLSIDGTSYSTGYAQGYNNGYINGNNIGTNTAYENGKNYANSNVNKDSASYKAGYAQGKSDGLDISDNPNNSLYGMVIRS